LERLELGDAMCQDLNTLRDAFIAYAACFDPSALSCAEAAEVVLCCARIEASVVSLKALAAARACEENSWHKDGYRSAADELAQRAKMSPASAKRALVTGRRLTNQPEVAKAALSGQLSSEQAAIVAEGVEANPGKEHELIDKAGSGSLGELSEEVARVKAETSDLEQRRSAIHARRFFRRWADRDGALQAHLTGQVQDGATIWGVLDPVRRRLAALREQARPRGQAREPFDALCYDALIALAEIASGKESELTFGELVGLGLFPQLDAEVLARRDAMQPGRGAPADDPADDPRGAPADDPTGAPAAHPCGAPAADPAGAPAADPAGHPGGAPADDPTGAAAAGPAEKAATEPAAEPADEPGASSPAPPASSASSPAPSEPGPVAPARDRAAAPGPARSAPGAVAPPPIRRRPGPRREPSGHQPQPCR
jgi:hypothetical protein